MGNNKMTFGTDEQTKNDLNIFSRHRGDLSIFDYYNRTITKGGYFELEDLMAYPSNDLVEIHQRMDTIRFIFDHQLKFEFDKDALDFIEHYLNQNTEILRNNLIDSSVAWVKNKLKPSNEYYIIMRGLVYLKEFIQALSTLTNDFKQDELPELFKDLSQTLDEFTTVPFIKKSFESVDISSREMSRLDSLIRVKEKGRVLKLLKLIYQLDAYMSIASVFVDKSLAFPKFIESDLPYLKLDAFFHPFLEEPVTNHIEISDHDNLCFVSGANMAGKSTFLKSMGVCIWLISDSPYQQVP